MAEKIEGVVSPQESGKVESVLNQVYQILRSDMSKKQQMMCDRMGDGLHFYTLFISEQAAQDAHDQLVKLGQQPKLDGRKVFLTAEFPGGEIDRLANTFNSIPKREEE